MALTGVCTFKTFGKSRRTSKTLQEIISTINKFAVPGISIKKNSVRRAAGFWSNVCKDLQVPNTFNNRNKIHQASLLLLKDDTDKEVIKEETPCPSVNLDVQETKADSDVICSSLTSNSESNCAFAEVEETIKRIQSQKGVQGIIIVNAEGIPIKSTLDNSSTVQYAGNVHQLLMKARGMVRDIDPQNDLTFLRVRSKKNEIMIAPDKDYFLIVIQNPTE
ncbi:dynein light chain roadblock-type 1 isoform X2 [Labeo rohita]|uniref:dynein light chain roadblock-type 1 isoform X2 n=1 Tax=Labeo rohita TaxID=84645 RepID=UPI0021E26487|nr:dynein light chain roadblock-type 1 isoform X2 [Labeo rohita]